MEVPTAGMTTASVKAMSPYETFGSQGSTNNETYDDRNKYSEDNKSDTSSIANEQAKMGYTAKKKNDHDVTPDDNGVNSKSECVHDTQLSKHTSEQNSGQTSERTVEIDSNSKVSYASDATESKELTSMEYRISEKNLTVDDSSVTEDDSDDSSDAESNQDAPKTINRTITSDRDFSPERKVKLNRHGFEDMRTKGELMPEELPPLEELTITVDETVEMVEVGTVASIVGVLVIVQSGANVPPLNDDTILFVEGHKVLGQVFEVFGPVKTPWYSIRFNDAGNIETKGIKPGTKVYCAPKEDSFTKFVFVDSVKRIKGSDASWEDNNEPPEKYLEFSDDEEEKRAKAKRKNKKKTGDSGGDEVSDGNIEHKKSRTSVQRWPPHDDPSQRDNSFQRRGRGHNPFRGRPDQQGNSNLTNSFSHRPHRPRMNHSQQEHFRYSAQTNNQFGRGIPPRFGGPPNFQKQQQFGFSKPFGPGTDQSVFSGNEGHPNTNAPNFFHHNQEPVPVNHNFPPPQMSGPPGQMRGPPPHMNGQPPQMNGTPPQMNGPSPQINGPPPQMNGPPPQMNFQSPNNPQIFQGPPPQPYTAPSNFRGGSVNISQGCRPTFPNFVGQIRPSQFKVHSLNPERPPNPKDFNQTSVSANKQFDQVNLTANVPAPYRPNFQNTTTFANPPESIQVRGQGQNQNNFTMTGNLDQQPNSRLVFSNPHQMNGSNSDPQGHNTGIGYVDNRPTFQGQYQGHTMEQDNQYWNSINSHSSNMEPLQIRKTNIIENQSQWPEQKRGHQPSFQSGQMTSNSTQSGYHGYQPQGCDKNNTFEMRSNRDSGGFSRFQAPQSAVGMYDPGINNKNFKNMQNCNVQTGHIVDHRFVQGN